MSGAAKRRCWLPPVGRRNGGDMKKHILEVAGGFIERSGRILLGRRPLGKSQGGLWEFIGGKLEPGETPEQALARECLEEIALPIVNEAYVTSVIHEYPERTIRLHLVACNPVAGAEPTALEHSELGWYSLAELETLDLCPADRELLPLLRNWLEGPRRS